MIGSEVFCVEKRLLLFSNPENWCIKVNSRGSFLEP